MQQSSILSQTKRKLSKSFLFFSFVFILGITSFVSFSYADTIEGFLASLATKQLGLQITENAAFEKDVYIGENVGIGTANPSEKLTVDGVIETSGGVKFADGTLLETGGLSGGSGGGSQYMILEDQKPSGTSGGNSMNTYQSRNLNTIIYNNIEGASLNSNKFVLPVGTYRIKFSAPALNCNNHKTRLQNVTDAIYPFYGTSEFSFYPNSTRSFGEGIVTIDSSKEFTVQHRCYYGGRTHGFGNPANMGTEVYTQVSIEKLN